MTAKATRKLKEAKQTRRYEIYETAARIFCEKTYDGTSVNDISEALGLTKTGLYHYIDGKSELLADIMHFGLDYYETEVIQPAKEVADAEERLKTIVRNHCLLVMRGSAAITVLIEEVNALPPAERQEIIECKRAYIGFVRETLQTLREEGKLRDIDAKTAAFSLFGMILWLPRWYQPGGKLSDEQIAEEMVKMAWHGLLR